MPGTPGIAAIFIVQSQSPANCFSSSCSLVFGSGICGAPPAFSWANSGNAATKRAADRTVVFFCMSVLLEQTRWMGTRPIWRVREPLLVPRAAAGARPGRWAAWRAPWRNGPVTLGLTEPALDVIRGLALLRGDEHLLGRAVLDDAADQHEHALVAGAARLRHVVGDDQDRVAAAQVPDQVLDRGRRLGVERRARLVRQQHLGLRRQQARDAQLLLLLERQR